MNKYLPILKKSKLFDGINDDEIISLLDCLEAKTKKYLKNDIILNYGDKTDSIGILLSGSVIITKDDFWGNQNLISRAFTGHIFGEAFACADNSIIDVNVIAETECLIMWINVKKIITSCPSSCSHHNKIIQNLLSDLAQKNLKFSEKLSHMGQRTTRDKLLSYLSKEAKRNNSSEFDIPFNRQQLADYLSVDRSAMSAELCKLRDSGKLTFNKNHFDLIENPNL